MLQIVFAVLAGMVTLAAPCTLPLLPILLGTSVGHTNRSRPLFIVSGFILMFTIAGVSLSFLASSLGIDPNAARIIGVIVLALFGVLLILPTLFENIMVRFAPFFAKAQKVGGDAGRGNVGGFFLGMTLGIIWTPCAGPVLGSILTLVAIQKEFVAAAVLLFAYSLGASVPMLLIAYGGQYLTSKILFFSKYTEILQKIFGVIIILLAIALFFNYDTKVYSILFQYFPNVVPKF